MRYACGTFILLVLLVYYVPVSHAKTLTFGSISSLSEQEVGRLILPGIYQSLGFELNIVPFPARRAETYAQSGGIDGEVMRIYEYGQHNPNLIRVPTPYYSVITTAFIRADSDIQLAAKEDLRQYTIAKVLGVRNSDLITRGIPNVSSQSDTKSIMKLLHEDFVDIAITNRVNGLLTIYQMDLDDIVYDPLPLGELPLYHYLHKKHKHLVPLLDAQIKSMKETGELEKLVMQAESTVISRFR